MNVKRFVLAAALLGVAPLAACDKASSPGMTSEKPEPAAAPAMPATQPPPPTTPLADALPPGHPPMPGATSAPAAPADPTAVEFLGMRGTADESWEWFAPTNRMRAFNYRVPGEGGEAEIVAFYFGQGMGGSKQANIDRWAGQFQGPDGGPVEAAVTDSEIDGMPAAFVELSGGYMGMGTEVTPDQLFLATIIEAPVGNVYIRFVGPQATVEAGRARFMEFVEGIRREGGLK